MRSTIATAAAAALLCLTTSSTGVAAFSFDAGQRRYAFHAPSNDEVLSHLEAEYKSLQDQLLRDLSTTNVHGNAESIVEDMLEKAADIAAFQRYKVSEIVEESDTEMKNAREDRKRAHFVKEQAHDEAASTAQDAAIVEEFDAAYEELERARDLSVVHADKDIEKYTANIEEESERLELDAGDRKKEALIMLKELQENEARLRASLQELRQKRSEVEMKEWRESSEGRAHVNFLEKVRNKIKHYSMKKHSDDL